MLSQMDMVSHVFSTARTLCMGVALVTCAGSGLRVGEAVAQEQVVERTVRALPGKDVQIGIYLNVLPDCSTGTLPSLRMITPPTNGAVNIKQGKVRATNYKQCLALEVPGFIAFYKSKPDFSGVDTVMIEVKYPAGRTEVQKISLIIGSGPPGQKI